MAATQLGIPGIASTPLPATFIALRDKTFEGPLLAGGRHRKVSVTLIAVHATGEAAQADAMARNAGRR